MAESESSTREIELKRVATIPLALVKNYWWSPVNGRQTISHCVIRTLAGFRRTPYQGERGYTLETVRPPSIRTSCYVYVMVQLLDAMSMYRREGVPPNSSHVNTTKHR